MVFERRCDTSYAFAFGCDRKNEQRSQVPTPIAFAMPRSSPGAGGLVGMNASERFTVSCSLWLQAAHCHASARTAATIFLFIVISRSRRLDAHELERRTA